ncbi:serine/threonine-protein kinase [Streptomyces sp. NPDC051994]|uniref:serine/threonine-protein kinase n=1 Tax=unclassified Streptomyces TaxID=2593676 RepID=UPI00343B88D3
MEALDARDPRGVSGYRILGRLGEGGMGRVYLARNRGGRSVALKLIHSDMAAVPGFRDRFRREVDAVQRVAGTGTVPVVDAGVDDQHPWYASDYLPGPSVQEAVDQFGPLPEETLWRFAADLAETLDDVHSKSLVHRDLKPSNVLLSSSGPKLIDFGIVHAALDTGLTMSGARIGTPVYMSPEQAYGERVTTASDIYSFGLTLAFAATGRTRRRGSEAPELSGVDNRLALLILHCLDPEPERRPTAAELHVRARAFDTTTDTWLPAQVASAIARTSEQLLNLEALDDLTQARTDTVTDDARAPGAGFHSATTHGPPPPHTAPSTPPPPPPPPPGTPYSTPRADYGYPQQPTVPAYGYPPTGPGAPNGVGQWQGSRDWVYGGLLGRPLLGLIWLLPLGIGSYLVVFAQPTFMGCLRVLTVPALIWMCVWLTAVRNRMPAGKWCGWNQTFWLVLAFFEVQGWWGISSYSAMGVAIETKGKVTAYQNVVDSLNGLFSLALALGSLALIYVVPAAIARGMRRRKEGF